MAYLNQSWRMGMNLRTVQSESMNKNCHMILAKNRGSVNMGSMDSMEPINFLWGDVKPINSKMKAWYYNVLFSSLEHVWNPSIQNPNRASELTIITQLLIKFTSVTKMPFATINPNWLSCNNRFRAHWSVKVSLCVHLLKFDKLSLFSLETKVKF